MKKITILTAAIAVALGFTACDDYEAPNPPVQTNPQEDAFNAENLTMTAVDDPEYILNLADINNAGEQAIVARYELSYLPTGYVTSVTMTLGNEDFSKSTTLPATLGEDGNVTVSPDLLSAAYNSAISKDPAPAKVYGKFRVAVGLAGAEAYGTFVDGPNDGFYGPFPITLMPFAPETVIEEAYYLVSDGMPEPVKFSHSDISVYDDPNFSLVLPNVEGEMNWAVIPESSMQTLAQGNYPSFVGSALSGTLVPSAGLGQAGLITVTGPVKVDINMQTLAYSIYQAYPYVYTPGGGNGWSIEASNMLPTQNYVRYSGFIYAADEFKFAATTDWSVNWGLGDAEGTLALNGGNIPVATVGCYYTWMDMTALTYAVTFIESVGIIGDATPAGWDGQTNLALVDGQNMVWSITVDLPGSGEFKFRMNDNWDINLGGDMLNLTEGGANIPAPTETGSYTITLDLSTLPYTCTVVKN